MEGIARQPEATGKIKTAMIIYRCIFGRFAFGVLVLRK